MAPHDKLATTTPEPPAQTRTEETEEKDEKMRFFDADVKLPMQSRV